MYEVAGLDDESITGFVRATQLVPRDSAAPVAVTVDALPTTISPNDDDAFDTTDLSARFSESVDWTLRVKASDGTVVRSTSGTGQEPVVTWAGLTDGVAVADGTLHVHVPRAGRLAERAGAGRQVRHGQGRHDAARAVGRRPGGR